MLRILGILVIIAGSSGCALTIVRERAAYLERCRSWRELLRLMENEIAFQKSSLPEICARAGRHLTGDKKIFLDRIGRALEEDGGETLGEIWRREAGLIFQREPVKREIEEEVEELGGRLCFEDGDLMSKILKEAEGYIRKHQEEQERISREKNKLTLCAGVMGGLLLTILLL